MFINLQFNWKKNIVYCVGIFSRVPDAFQFAIGAKHFNYKKVKKNK